MSEVYGINSVEANNKYNGPQSNKVNSTSTFASYLGESKTMDQIFQEAADKYNVPVNLLKAVGKAESNFNAKAVSRVGAQGVMQLMPATAKELGVTDAFDAEQNIMGGAKYISRLLKKYNGDTKLALAAYNAGSGNVAKYNGIPPFKETQGYVKKVMGYYGGGNIEIAENNNVTGSNSKSQVIITGNPINSTSISSNLSYLFTDGSSKDSDLDELVEIFSYDDYLKFIDLFLEEEEEEKSSNEEKDNTTKLINYNAPIINLLNNL